MKLFTPLLALTALFTGLALAKDDQDVKDYLAAHGYASVTGATATTLAHALQSVYSEIETRSQYSEAWSVLQTATNTPTATNSLIEHVTTTAPPGWYTGLPKKVKTELLKEQNMLQSAADKALGVTRTSEGRGMETKVPVVGGVAVAGFLGGVAML